MLEFQGVGVVDITVNLLGNRSEDGRLSCLRPNPLVLSEYHYLYHIWVAVSGTMICMSPLKEELMCSRYKTYRRCYNT